MALTKQDIWHTADELDTEGTRPTLQAVRKRLGRGSFTTIQDAMKEWRSQQTTNDAPSAEALPEAVSEEIERAGTAIWQAAMSAAHRRLEEERQQLTTEREALEARATEATELADSLSRENEALQKELEDLRRQTDEDLARRAGDIEAARKETQEARERAVRMEGQVSALKEQFEALTIANRDQKPAAKTSAPRTTTRKSAPAAR
ncbi:MAG: DNA-binding protein [Candidatus Thiosymbion ectosymbiont of Robbea hypermnestra]|nr:DNA-binding protein [Candidatus Thiosymbion ectosymbiont of Robbea hypermnestra]